MTVTTTYLGVYKATYDYKAQGEDEISIEEDQLLFLLDNSDEEWSKVKIKTSADDSDGAEGLVPASYIEEAPVIATVKAQYDYEATAQGEISIEEDWILSVYEREDEWILVKSNQAGKIAVGYVPANYVEDDDAAASDAGERSIAPAAIIVPDSPPRPAYVDPAERSAAASAAVDKTKQDPIETWSVSQVDKKGKKKKGTLGVGNGAIFFASESDKTPVQKWQTADILDVTIDKSKHVQIELSGSEPLHFHSKDAAEAIVRKVESSRALSDQPRPSTDSRAILSPSAPRAVEIVSSRTSEPTKSVHFAAAPAEIPPRPDTPQDDEADGEVAVALYDFVGDANDELSVKEGETLVVLDRTNDDWWKCRNQKGDEGVVPAQYVDLDTSDGDVEEPARGKTTQNAPSPEPEPEPEEDSEDERERAAEAARLAREKVEKERQQKEKARAERELAERKARAQEEDRLAAERKKAEELKAKAAAAAKTRKLQKEDEARKRGEGGERKSSSSRKKSRKAEPDDDDESEDDNLADKVRKLEATRLRERDGDVKPSSGATKQAGPPPTGKTRIWHDRTGQFRVEAEFKGFENGKIRLHKLNGVTIEVPSEKMSPEDIEYIAKMTGTSRSKASPPEAESRRSSARPVSTTVDPPARTARSSRPDPQPKKYVDWFEFFLNAGCDMDDCTRYGNAFEKDKIDDSILPDMRPDTLRALGLREGDIIRVMKAIEKGNWTAKSPGDEPRVKDQIRADEEYAQRVQAAELAGQKPPPPPGPLPQKRPVAPAPNIFSGPGGVLKDNTRRGRPTAATRSASINVDEDRLASASDQLRSSPTVTTPGGRTPSPNLLDISSSSSATKGHSFEDDAWTVRPSSTNPISPVAAVTPPAAPASAPPNTASTITAPTPTLAAPTVAAPARASTTSPTLASSQTTTEQDLLAKIENLRRAPSAPIPATQPPQFQQPSNPSLFNQVANTPSLAPQPTGFYPSLTPPLNNVRGPFAPVPANEAVLLKPLIPITTGLNGFVPTRPTNGSNTFIPRPLLSQPTGYAPTLMSQPTGYPGMMPMMSQPTGLPFGFAPMVGAPPVPALPPQFNPAPTFNPPPINTQPLSNLQFGIPPATPTGNNHAPENVFASMKMGNFGGEEHNQQGGDKYEALRQVQQPTGWIPGMQTGYQYH